MNFSEHIAHGYFFAKQYIINKGFAEEIDWQDHINIEFLTEQDFLEEIAWVILSSGMNEKVIKKLFPFIRTSLMNFESAALIASNKTVCHHKCLKVFNHVGKIDAIIYAAEYISTFTFEVVKQQIKAEGLSFISQFPYLGAATSRHLAKNIGIDIAKPDRHLIRISETLGYGNPDELCSEISSVTNEKVCLIDLVLWRYATLDRNYVDKLRWYISKCCCEVIYNNNPNPS